MDPEKDEKLKQSAEALAYHVFGVLSQMNALKNTVSGFDAGLRSVEQTFGPLPLALPHMPAPPSTDKKQKPSRKVRPALRPSGGSGVGALVAGATAAGGTGSPTKHLALLEGLDKELNGQPLSGHHPGGISQPLTTPNVAADGACIVGRLSDAHGLGITTSPAEGGPGPVAPSHGSTEAIPGATDDGSENENGGSNEAGVGVGNNNAEGPPSSAGDGSGGGSGHGEQGDMPHPPLPLPSETAPKDDSEFTFDPLGTASKNKLGTTKATIGNKRQTTGAPAGATASADQPKPGSPSLPAKRTRKNASSEPNSGS